MYDFLTDATLVTLSCAYARWLDEHKDLEPDGTWIEVGIGVAYCLAHAYAYGLRHGGDWRAHHRAVWRSFALGGIPIVVGEVAQWLRRRAARRLYRPYRHEE